MNNRIFPQENKLDKRSFIVKTSTVLDEVNGINYMKIYPLISGRVLVEDVQDANTDFSIYDLSSFKKIHHYSPQFICGNDYLYYLPEGPVLKPFNEAMEVSLTQLFMLRLAVQYRHYFNKIHRPHFDIAYLGNHYFVVLNKNTVVLDNATFDLFSMEGHNIKKLGQLHNNKSNFPNPFFSSFSNYLCHDTQQVFSTTGHWLCIVYKENQLDVWKRTAKNVYKLHASFNLNEKLFSTIFQVRVNCLTITPDDILICQAKREHKFISLLKINLPEKKLLQVVSIKKNHIDSPYENFYGLESMTPIKNSNLYVAKDHFSAMYFVDSLSLSVQNFKLPTVFIDFKITQTGEVIAHDYVGHNISRITLPYIDNYLINQKNQVDESRNPILYQYIYPKELINIINQYSEDYYVETPNENSSKKTDKTHISIRQFSFFCKNPDWIDRSLNNPIDFFENTMSKKIFK